MKKIISLVFVVLLFVICGCAIPTEVKKTVTIEDDYITMYIGKTYEINPVLDGCTSEELELIVVGESISLDGYTVTGISQGGSSVKVQIKGTEIYDTISFNIKAEPIITIYDDYEMVVGDEEQINCSASNVQKITFSSSNDSVATISEGGLIKAVGAGVATIKAEYDGYFDECEVVVVGKPSIVFKEEEIDLIVGEEVTLEVEAANLNEKIEWDSSDSSIVSVKNGVIKALKAGKCVITAEADKVEATIEINVTKDNIAPTISLDPTKANVTIGWNENYNIYDGITAIDNIDGDISSKLQLKSAYDNQKYGVQEVTIVAKDSSGNEVTVTKTVNVIWNYSVQFIGHAGSYYGLMNSEEAILYAAKELKYQAIEIDLKQTKDGVFVLSHDDTFNGVTIASKNWNDIKDLTYTSTRNSGFPAQNGSVTKDSYTAKLCTLERYLEICKQYNCKAVIELKSSNGITNSDQSRMQALMDVIEKCGMRSQVIFLASQYNCLIWTREHGYEDIPCQYLVNSCESETYLQRCIDYNLDISINTTATYSNSDEWLARYKEYGLKVSTYTYTQYVNYDQVQLWINKGVDFVTCDWHKMSELQLPVKSEEETEEYTVTFKDYDGKVLKEAKVKKGRTAAAPKTPSRLGYTFKGWDKEIKNITSNLEVTAVYEIDKYSIKFNDNLTVITETSWADKTAFVTEFYDDLYQWFKDYGVNSSFVTENNGTFTVTKNGKTVTFSNAADLKAIDIYDFELTISNFIYKPVTRLADGTCIIEDDNNYFLNTNPYKIKYQALDQWFVNCIKNNYSSYDNTYKPLSSGKIQIMFRFHQWCKGTSIPAFNVLPKKYDHVKSEGNVTLPDEITYDITMSVELQKPTCDSKVFKGWSTTPDGKELINKIEAGTTGNMLLYAIWE